jgi:hypothetical protein
MPEGSCFARLQQPGDNMMSKLTRVALAAALGFAVSAPVYAADTSSNSSTAWSDSQVRAAMDKCESLNLTGTAEAKCIVNIRRTPAGNNVSGSNYPSDSALVETNVVRDGTARAEDEYAAALKECEAVKSDDRDRCVNIAKERFGRM